MGSKRKQALQVVHPDCAGIDVGKREHYVAVRETDTPDWLESSYRLVESYIPFIFQLLISSHSV